MTGGSASVLVTDGDQRASLAVVRALGQAGLSVAAGESRASSLAASSRYCSRAVQYPSPGEAPREFQRFLCEEAERGRYDFLLPMTDASMQLAGEIREQLARRVRTPFPALEQIRQAQDKGYVLRLANRLGIPCPESYLLEPDQRVEDLAVQLRYPVVIKPRFSWLYGNGRWHSGQVEFARTAEELVAKYRQVDAQIPQPLVQETISGDGKGAFLLVWDGRLYAAFCHRRLREKPPWGGVSVYCESLPMDRELVGQSFSLLEALGWQGAAMVEFKVDQRDGRAKLMEVNGRFWGSLQLAIDAGMNFPLLLYRLAQGESLGPQTEYRVGVKSRWLLGDLDNLLIQWRHDSPLNGAAGHRPSRLRSGLQFLRLYEPDLHYDVFRWSDPAPGWFELKSYVRAAFRSLGRSREVAHAD